MDKDQYNSERKFCKGNLAADSIKDILETK